VIAYRCVNCRWTCTNFTGRVPSCGRCGSGPAWMREEHREGDNGPLQAASTDGKMVSTGGNTND